MDSVRVSVVNAISNEAMLADEVVNATGCVDAVLAELGHRPSRPISLLLNGELLGRDFVPAGNKKLRLTAVHGQGISEEERAAALQAVRQDGRRLEHVSQACRDDKEIVLEAVREDGDSFRYASEACRNDKEIVLEAVRRDCRGEFGFGTGYNLAHAGKACRADREVVLAAVRHNGRSLHYASKACRADKEIVLEAVRQDGWSLKYASEACRDDKQVVLAAVRQHRHSLKYASRACRKNEKILRACENGGGSGSDFDHCTGSDPSDIDSDRDA